MLPVAPSGSGCLTLRTATTCSQNVSQTVWSLGRGWCMLQNGSAVWKSRVAKMGLWAHGFSAAAVMRLDGAC